VIIEKKIMLVTVKHVCYSPGNVPLQFAALPRLRRIRRRKIAGRDFLPESEMRKGNKKRRICPWMII
jgi:hypothetical protein